MQAVLVVRKWCIVHFAGLRRGWLSKLKSKKPTWSGWTRSALEERWDTSREEKIFLSSSCEGKENANEDTQAGPTCGDHHVYNHLHRHYLISFFMVISSRYYGRYGSPFHWVVDGRPNQLSIYLPLCRSKTHFFFFSNPPSSFNRHHYISCNNMQTQLTYKKKWE